MSKASFDDRKQRRSVKSGRIGQPDLGRHEYIGQPTSWHRAAIGFAAMDREAVVKHAVSATEFDGVVWKGRHAAVWNQAQRISGNARRLMRKKP